MTLRRRASPYLLATASGMLQFLTFPPFDYSLLAPIAISPLLIAVAHEASRRKQFLLGAIAGWIFWGTTCYWIYDVLNVYGNMPAPPAATMFVGF